ncbi:MAG: hypothetical protein NWR54_15855, partial [Paracoccaceae bacterium]|nr:hypothetical protein [Paracoccaceae bacterium]
HQPVADNLRFGGIFFQNRQEVARQTHDGPLGFGVCVGLGQRGGSGKRDGTGSGGAAITTPWPNADRGATKQSVAPRVRNQEPTTFFKVYRVRTSTHHTCIPDAALLTFGIVWNSIPSPSVKQGRDPIGSRPLPCSKPGSGKDGS